MSKHHLVALAGNPNAGKTTLFNALTGARAKVGNYPGVTVDRRIGKTRFDDCPVGLAQLSASSRPSEQGL